MRLLNITLSNFRRYEDARFQFHPRFTVLTGENGKGKTTVLDAVAVMLGTCFKNSKIRTGQNVLRKTDARLVMHEIGGQVYFEDRHSVDGKVDYSHVYIEAVAVIALLRCRKIMDSSAINSNRKTRLQIRRLSKLS